MRGPTPSPLKTQSGRRTMNKPEIKSRRHFLRGAGVALALPWMESLPAFSAGQPRGRGSRSQQAAAALRHHLLFQRRQARALVGKRRAAPPWSSARSARRSRPTRRTSSSSKVSSTSRPSAIPARTRAATPICSRAPGSAGPQRHPRRHHHGPGAVPRDRRPDPVPSMALGIEPNELRLEDGLSMIYGSNISWATPTKPATKEIYPARAFDQLVGDGKGRKLDRSILDAVMARDARPPAQDQHGRPKEARRISGIGARHREAHRYRVASRSASKAGVPPSTSPTCRVRRTRFRRTCPTT